MNSNGSRSYFDRGLFTCVSVALASLLLLPTCDGFAKTPIQKMIAKKVVLKIGINALKKRKGRGPFAKFRAPQQRGKRNVGFWASFAQKQSNTGTLILADRPKVVMVKEARKLIEKKEYITAIELLQKLLDENGDAFFYPNSAKKHLLRSLKTEATLLIGNLPRPGLDAYELKYGSIAKRLLKEAMATNSTQTIEEVSRRYFHTTAGHKATLYLGSLRFDQSQFLTAALHFNKLRALPERKRWEPALSLRTALCWKYLGMKEASVQVLESLKKEFGGNPLRLGNRTIAWAKPSEDNWQWLQKHFGSAENSHIVRDEDWLMAGGNPGRTNLLPSSTEKRFRKFSFSTVYDPMKDPSDTTESDNDKQLKKIVGDLNRTYRHLKQNTFPQLAPLIVQDRLIFRSVGMAEQRDLTQRNQSWGTVPDDTLDLLLTSNGGFPVPGFQTHLKLYMDQRIWKDRTYGSMSSDGKRLYCIEDAGTWWTISSRQNPFKRRPSSSSRLRAYDLETGKILWSLGGPTDDLLPDQLAGSFFLGPPLPLGDRLYALADVRSEVRLVVIKPRKSGQRQWAEIEWTQPLAMANSQISGNRIRRLAGLSPSYQDGVLVCPTGAGSIVAIDMAQRSLMWGYQYRLRRSVNFNNPFQRIPRPQPPKRQNRQSGWKKNIVMISQGKVFATDEDSQELACLNLLDGAVMWKIPRENALYLAGIERGKVLVVSPDEVRAFQLSSGKAAWEPIDIENPSGYGIVVGGKLCVPLRSGKVVLIDVRKGTITRSIAFPKGHTPGNLVYWKGTLISQNADRVESVAFEQENIEKKIPRKTPISQPTRTQRLPPE